MTDDVVERLRRFGTIGLEAIAMIERLQAELAQARHDNEHVRMSKDDEIERLRAAKGWNEICDVYADNNQRFSDEIERLRDEIKRLYGYGVL